MTPEREYKMQLKRKVKALERKLHDENRSVRRRAGEQIAFLEYELLQLEQKKYTCYANTPMMMSR